LNESSLKVKIEQRAKRESQDQTLTICALTIYRHFSGSQAWGYVISGVFSIFHKQPANTGIFEAN